MIIGKKSALKGFGLFFWAVCLVLTFAGSVMTKNALFIIPSLGLAAVNVYQIRETYRRFAQESESVYKNRRR